MRAVSRALSYFKHNISEGTKKKYHLAAPPHPVPFHAVFSLLTFVAKYQVVLYILLGGVFLHTGGAQEIRSKPVPRVLYYYVIPDSNYFLYTSNLYLPPCTLIPTL